MGNSEEQAPTEAQLGIWLGHQRSQDPTVFHAAECVVLEGPLDPALFERALDATLRESDALHVAFPEVDGRPVCRPVAYSGLALEHVSLEHDPGSLVEHAERTARRPLDLEHGPLYRHQLVRLGPERHAWLHVAHHVLLDGYGFQLVAARCAEHFNSLVARGEPATSAPLAPLGPVFAEDAAYQSSESRERDRAFWAEELGARRGISWSGSTSTGFARRVRRVLDAELADAVRREAASAGVSWADLLLAVVAARTGDETAARSFLIGLPVMQRLGSKAARTPCMAMNIAALPVDLDPRATRAELARAIRAGLTRQRRHQRYRYEHLRVDRQELGGALFGPVVNVLPFAPLPAFGACAAKVVRISAGPVEDVAITLAPSGAEIELMVDGHSAHFEEAELARLADALVADARAWVGAMDAPIVERREIPSTLASLHARALERPDAPALAGRDLSLTYAELVAATRRLADQLAEQGCGAGSLVAIELPPGPLAILAILATQWLGAGYVALDSAQPRARRQRIVDAARPTAVIGGDELRLPPGARRVALELPERAALARAAHELVAPPPRSATDTAYVVFTSGSTGEPKGVQISAGALSSFVEAAASVYRIGPGDRVSTFAPLTFDASVEEIFVTLASGATLVLRDERAMESPADFFAYCERAEISVLDLPTAFWHELALAMHERGLRLPGSVRLVIIGGEAAAPERVAQWAAGAPHARLLNTYGPSEATVVATVAELSVEAVADGVPIGTPLPGVEALLLDEHGEVIDEPGRSGELVLLGPTLATGYLGRFDLTRERFVWIDGRRAYRTGDRAVRRADGALVHLGRVDDEVKISGHRISPAEVEAALCRHPRVRAALVWGEASTAGHGARLVACVEGEGVDALELRRFLAELLPPPMVPASIQVTARLPRTSHGKLDRSAIARTPAAPSGARSSSGLGPLEARIVAAWREVLGVAEIGLDDDFFALGGTSLHVIQLANRLSRAGVEIRVADVFRRPTPRAQAALLASNGAPRSADAFEPGPVELPREWFSEPLAAAEGAGRVLLTGATGFVGVHVLERWLRVGDETFVCPVRERDDAAARARLFAHAVELGVDLSPYADRIEVIACDLASMTRERWLAEVAPCAVVFHCAARVSLSRSFESLAADNVEATRGLIGAAARWGAELHYVSTIAVAPAGAPEELVPVHDGLVDGYQRSKWLGEALVGRAAELGTRVAIHRLGRVTGPRSRPTVQPNDLVWRIARASARVGAWPDLDVAEPWIPADDAADAMIALVRGGAASRPATVLHLVHTGTVPLSSLRDALVGAGYRLRTVSVAEWIEQVRAGGDEEDRATLSFFELRARDGRPRGRSEIPCERVLERLGRGAARAVGDDLVAAYCRHARESGLLPPVERETAAARGIAAAAK